MDYNLLSELSKKKREKTKKDEEDVENKIINQEISKESDVDDAEKEKKKKKDHEDKKKELENEKDEDPIEYSKPIKWDQVKIDRLEYKNFGEIKFIATSIGIFKNGIKKHDLIKKIKNFIKINNEIIENKIKRDSINPFNKNTFGSLVIPIGGKDGENELLFWKVFKNKSIFKTIMSHTQTLSTSMIQYDHIVSVESMLKNNQINILKDKVKSNKYLSFFSYVFHTLNSVGKNEKEMGWYALFLKIQDDKQFYRNLFKNYKDQISFVDNNNKFGITVGQLIASNCIMGLQVLIEIFLYIPTILDLKDSISIYRLELIKLILPYISNEEIENNIDSIVSGISYYYSDSNYNNFNIYNNNNNNTRDDEYYDTIKYLIHFLKTNKKHSDTAIPRLIKILFDLFKSEKKENLKTLIELVTFLDSLDYWETFKKLAIQFKYPWHKEESFNINDIELLIDEFKNKIESIKSIFSNDQLESSVYHPINHQSKENETISKLLSIYHIVNNPRSDWLFEYFICYGGEFKVKEDFKLNEFLNRVSGDMKNKFAFGKVIIEHANYRIWSTSFFAFFPQIYEIYDPYFYYYFLENENFILFNKCPKRESQIELIDNLINDILLSSNFAKDNPSPMFLLMLLVKNNNLELVDYFFSKVDKSLIDARAIYFFNEYSIFKNIKSIEMFEYLYNKLDHFSFSIYMEDPKYSKHLETMAINKNLNFSKITFSHQAKLSVSFIKYVFENSSNYNLDDILLFKPIDLYENHNDYFQCLIDQINKVQGFISWSIIDEYHMNHNFTLIPLKSHRIAFKIYQNFSPRNYYSRFSSHLLNYYFDNMENDNLFQDDEIALEKFGEYLQVIELSTIRADLKTLDRVLAICEKLYSKGNKDDLSKIESIILNNILKVTVYQQQIFTLEYLLSNHMHIFKKKTDSKSKSNSNDNFRNGIFTHNELRELVFISLGHYNIKFTNLLLSTITITKIQFQKHSSKPIYYHFKDRFK
ncbi:hypothetical protein ACTFIR_001918 [Dictyostelium discoideum]